MYPNQSLRGRFTQEGLTTASGPKIVVMCYDRIDRDLDARHAAARGHVDLIVTPEETRAVLGFLLQVTSRYAGPHLGPFVLPALDAR